MSAVTEGMMNSVRHGPRPRELLRRADISPREANASERIFSADEANEDDDDGDDKKEVDESADGVRRNKTQEPKDKQQRCDGE